jgi:hypothetical protein
MFNLERLERRVAEACGTDRIRYHFGMFAVRNARAVPRNASPTPDAALGWPMQTTSACKRSGATISDGLASGGVRLARFQPNRTKAVTARARCSSPMRGRSAATEARTDAAAGRPAARRATMSRNASAMPGLRALSWTFAP